MLAALSLLSILWIMPLSGASKNKKNVKNELSVQQKEARERQAVSDSRQYASLLAAVRHRSFRYINRGTQNFLIFPDLIDGSLSYDLAYTSVALLLYPIIHVGIKDREQAFLNSEIEEKSKPLQHCDHHVYDRICFERKEFLQHICHTDMPITYSKLLDTIKEFRSLVNRDYFVDHYLKQYTTMDKQILSEVVAQSERDQKVCPIEEYYQNQRDYYLKDRELFLKQLIK